MNYKSSNMVDWDYFPYFRVVHGDHGIALKDFNGWLLNVGQQTLGL